MSKWLLIAVVALSVSITTSAQIVESKSRRLQTTDIMSLTDVEPNRNYNRVFFGYAPLKGVWKGGIGPEGSEKVNGFSAGWLGGYNVSNENRLPLYVEAGLAMNAQFGKVETRHDKLLSFELPVNITYRYNIKNTPIHIAPYLGLHFKVNALIVDEYGRSYFNSEEYNVRRFQMGMQLGVNLDYKKFFLGLGWNRDFIPIASLREREGYNVWGGEGKAVTSGFRLNVGVVF